MTDKEVLRMAQAELLHVLASINSGRIPLDGDAFHEALYAIKAALAQPVSEPKQLQWTDAAGVKYAFPLQGATQLLADLYARWPGGLTEIESAMRTMAAQPVSEPTKDKP
tara:strand:- start:1861 stop:2190 length:330 start_codon:yes stop_codon:yes gene_type:complete